MSGRAHLGYAGDPDLPMSGSTKGAFESGPECDQACQPSFQKDKLAAIDAYPSHRIVVVDAVRIARIERTVAPLTRNS
jgi:hypothetical protein